VTDLSGRAGTLVAAEIGVDTPSLARRSGKNRSSIRFRQAAHHKAQVIEARAAMAWALSFAALVPR